MGLTLRVTRLGLLEVVLVVLPGLVEEESEVMVGALPSSPDIMGHPKTVMYHNGKRGNKGKSKPVPGTRVHARVDLCTEALANQSACQALA